MHARVKICGLTTPQSVHWAADAGARYVGFVFFPKSPRDVGIELARDLALETPLGVAKVGLVVDPSDAFLDDMLAQVPLDMIQLHGHESPERVTQIKERYGLPVMKAIGIATQDDLPLIDRYADVADQLLIDAKPNPNAVLPGGNGHAFDWALMADYPIEVPWMLAGGLTPENAAQALRVSGAQQLDVSSGVEEGRGVKSEAKIKAFLEQVSSVSL
ncbi:MAG: phosphoribosylanthranilate isomerase [Paracoccaceae bacterium]